MLLEFFWPAFSCIQTRKIVNTNTFHHLVAIFLNKCGGIEKIEIDTGSEFLSTSSPKQKMIFQNILVCKIIVLSLIPHMNRTFKTHMIKRKKVFFLLWEIGH